MAESALRRVEAVEDLRTSRTLCRLRGDGGQGFATVRLQPSSNTRSLVFNDDVVGVETRVRCEGAVDATCLAGPPAPGSGVQRAEECPACPCARNLGQLYGAYAIAMAEE
eukprot:CAMPEP_0179102930 /NCGR_PEP_ID=MMETSP0796-20121207/47665_1 /TAXON_ID=73915 /ORGANISM="Pyrodinium bahamense, Strain pbaha01" /LENGTH=109 /DNA_ID=CAMNT_0020800819 /DNA_START=12 /DNA_END=338 /DNA_ORIENTATION=+